MIFFFFFSFLWRDNDEIFHLETLIRSREMTRYEYPAVVVFDLDYTLWPCWCDTHLSPPIKPVSKTRVVDHYGMELSMYKDVESIMVELEANGVEIVGASRTATPRIAQELLSRLHINGKPSMKYFANLQWGQGSKTRHILRAAKELGMTKELEAGMFILFDDEWRNRDVESINCHFGHIVDERKGLTREIFEKKLIEWTKLQNEQH